MNNNGECVDIDFGPDIGDSSGKKDYYYEIPSNAAVEANLDYNNVNKYNDFDINRWLKHQYNQVSFLNVPESMPFGFGRRDCVGKELARKELYSFLANLLINYRFMPANGPSGTIDIQFDETKFPKQISPPIGVLAVPRRT